MIWSSIPLNGLMETTRQVVWDSLLDYDRLEWQRTLHDFNKVPDVAYQHVLDDFDLAWCHKGLIVTRSNLPVTWESQTLDGHYFLVSLGLGLVYSRFVILVSLTIEYVSISTEEKEEEKT